MRVWDHHVEIWNDGELPPSITPENILDSHASYPRNKNLAFAFYKANFIESWGRGWQKICNGFQEAGLPKPTIESKQGGVLVTFQRNNVNLKMTDGTQIGSETTESTEKSTEKSTLIGTPKSSPKGSPKTREVIVELMRKNQNVTIVEIAAAVHTSERNVKKHIKILREQGLLRRIDGNKGGHWEIVE